MPKKACKHEILDQQWTKKNRSQRIQILTKLFENFAPHVQTCITLIDDIHTHRTSPYNTLHSMYLIDDEQRSEYDGDVVRYVSLHNGLDKVQTSFYQRTDAIFFLINQYYTSSITKSYQKDMPGIAVHLNEDLLKKKTTGIITYEEFYEKLGFQPNQLIDLGIQPVPTNRLYLNKLQIGTEEQDDIIKRHVKGFGSDRINHRNGVRMIYLSNSVFEEFVSNTSDTFTTQLFHPDLSKETWDQFIQFLSTYVDIDDKHKQFTKENIKQIQQELITMESYIYKIHLQPKNEYYYWTIYKLSLLPLPYITTIKFRIYEKDPSLNLPVIVLYVNAEYTSNIDEIVNDIKVHFDPFSDTIGSNITPRYNVRINHLIFLSQGNGDTKKIFNTYGILDNYFDKEDHGSVLPLKQPYRFQPTIKVRLLSDIHEFMIEHDKETIKDLKKAIQNIQNIQAIQNIQDVENIKISLNKKSLSDDTKLMELKKRIVDVL